MQQLIDHHMHTQASPDADQRLAMEDYIEKLSSSTSLV